ncbi:MAG: DUF72 domain-containing protein [Dehalococcoidia bacterium]
MVEHWHVGCSGWSYKHWRGDFYPEDLPQRAWFEHYAGQFDTVEINSTFYRLPSSATVQKWADEAPRGFKFAIKASQFITHYHRLQDSDGALKKLFDRMEPLGAHEGPILYQLPERFERDDERLSAFLHSLPSHHHHAMEFRHESWWTDEVFELLRKRHVAFVMFSMGKTQTPVVATSAHAYVRFHGPQKYRGGYETDDLRWWRDQLGSLDASNAWVYFNNDAGGHAPKDARALLELLHG